MIKFGESPDGAPQARRLPIRRRPPHPRLFLRRIGLIAMISLALLLALAACEGETGTSEQSTQSPQETERSSTSSDPEGTSRPSDVEITPEPYSPGQTPSPGSSSQGGGVSDGGSTAGDSGSGPTPTPTPLPEFPAEAVDGDYDWDDDGLIEIRTLAQLDAMRLDPKGTGFVQDQEGREQYFAAFQGWGGPSGCLDETCTGYELAAHLDFDTNGNGEADAGDEYWNDGAGWQPLPGISHGVTFDGNGYSISNLYISVTVPVKHGSTYLGLFSNNGGQIRNVSLVSVHVELNTERGVLGGLVGSNIGTVSTSSVSGTILGGIGLSVQAGGLLGRNGEEGTVSGCEFSGDVLGNGTVGGLVGNNAGGISDSRAGGAVSNVILEKEFPRGLMDRREAIWSRAAGGLVGQNSGAIARSEATSDVTGIHQVGGLVGYNGSGSITDSRASGAVSGTYDVGGLVGDMLRGSVSQSEASGSVSGILTVGGLIGRSGAVNYGVQVNFSEASGDVSGNRSVGGLVGRANSTHVSGSRATGNVSGGENVGGLIGYSRLKNEISDSSAAGKITGAIVIGGLVGYNRSLLTNSEAQGGVTGGEYVGGLVGFNTGTIEDSVSSGDVSGDLFRGNVAGVNDGGNITGSEGLGALSPNEEPISMADRDFLISSGLVADSVLPSAGYTYGSDRDFDRALIGKVSILLNAAGRVEWLRISLNDSEMPPELGSLTSLRVLGLSGVSGDIPPELGNLSNLTFLELWGDWSWSGEIPAELGNLSSLTFLSLYGVSGEIPPELGNLTSLTVLRLSGDGLTGCIPSSLSGIEYTSHSYATPDTFSTGDNLPFCN